MFETGKEYSREDVHQVTGGSKHAFLPVKGGKVVAARLRPDLNPHAPEVILCDGSASSRAAGRTLARQIEAVPVFVRTSSDRFGMWASMLRIVVLRLRRFRGLLG
jgi:hypothetical protein